MRAAGRVPPGVSAGLRLLPVSCFLPEWSVFSQMRPINGHSSFDSEVTCGRCRPPRARGHLPLVVLTGGDGSLNAGSGRGARSPPHPAAGRPACHPGLEPLGRERGAGERGTSWAELGGCGQRAGALRGCPRAMKREAGDSGSTWTVPPSSLEVHCRCPRPGCHSAVLPSNHCNWEKRTGVLVIGGYLPRKRHPEEQVA